MSLGPRVAVYRLPGSAIPLWDRLRFFADLGLRDPARSRVLVRLWHRLASRSWVRAFDRCIERRIQSLKAPPRRKR